MSEWQDISTAPRRPAPALPGDTIPSQDTGVSLHMAQVGGAEYLAAIERNELPGVAAIKVFMTMRDAETGAAMQSRAHQIQRIKALLDAGQLREAAQLAAEVAG